MADAWLAPLPAALQGIVASYCGTLTDFIPDAAEEADSDASCALFFLRRGRTGLLIGDARLAEMKTALGR